MSQFFINAGLDKIERYDFIKFLDYQNEELDPLTSYFLQKLQDLPVFSYKSVGALEGRADLLAYSIYGDVQYWWILLEYNSITDPEDLPANLTIAYPSLADLETLYYSLKPAQNARGL